MQFTLRQLLLITGIIALLLAIARWQPFFGICVALVFFPTVVTAILFRRARSVFMAALLPLTIVVYLWVLSGNFSMHAHWGPQKTFFQVSALRGRIFFFRFLGSRDPSAPRIEIYENPLTNHWSEWPGFHQEKYTIRLPGAEFARSKYIVPMMSNWNVDGVEIVSLSCWFVVVAIVAIAGLLTLIKVKIRPASNVG